MAEIGTVSLRWAMRLQPGFHGGADGIGALDELLLLDHVQHRQGGGAGDRRAGIGAAEPARLGGVDHRGTADHGREREAAGQRFGDGDHVGLHAGMLDAEHPAGAAEAGLHLVDDQQDAMAVAERAQAFEQFGGGGDEAAFALHRFQHDGGDARGLDVGAEQPSRWR